jgi:hypothetical protein
VSVVRRAATKKLLNTVKLDEAHIASERLGVCFSTVVEQNTGI